MKCFICDADVSKAELNEVVPNINRKRKEAE